ncbi:MAG: polyprenyl synthetase family protein [Deltaproteobacteria bacterium]|nr:polyprenyl synthetase family protein [Deltaproteobacteria bacterium]
MNLATYFNERGAMVEAALRSAIVSETTPPLLIEAMRYSLEAGGKRLRPILAIAGAEAVGGAAANVMSLAVAIEMIHTFSLIHDDLPAMDNDDLRRGRPTNHKVYGDAMAILAGDALVVEAFSILARSSYANPNILLEVMRDVADAAGGKGMTGGQVQDIKATGKKITESELEQLHRMKTGKLITVPVVGGAKLCGASPQQVTALQVYGEALGLAFQIADDILDIEGSEAEIGKDVGSDIDSNKATYPAIIGMSAAKKKARACVDQAVSALAVFDDRADPLRAIAQFVIERRK